MAKIGKVEVDTQKAIKSIKELENEIKNTKKELDGIGDGSTGFKKVEKGINDITQTTKKAAEAVSNLGDDLKLTNKYAEELSLGKLLPQFSSIAGGISGGFNVIGTAVKLFGSDTEESNQALSEMTALLQSLPIQFIAITQGLQTFGGVLKTVFTSNLFKTIDDFSGIVNKLLEGINSNPIDISNINKIREYINTVAKVSPDFRESFDDLLPLFDEIEDRVNNYIEQLKMLESTEKLTNLQLSRGFITDDQAVKLLDEVNERVGKLNENWDDVLEEINVQLAKANKTINETSKELVEQLSLWEKLKIQIALVKSEMGAAFAPFTVGIGVIVASITAITTGIIKLYKATKVAADEQKRLLTLMYDYGRNVPLKGLQDAATEYMNIDAAFRNAYTKTNGIAEQQKALERLNELVPEFKGKLNTLTGEIEGNTQALDEHVIKLKEEAKAQAAVSTLVELEKKRLGSEMDIMKYEDQLTELQGKIATAQREAIESISAYGDGGVFVNAVAAPYEKEAKEISKLLENAKKQNKSFADQIEWIYKNLNTNVEAQQKKSGNNEEERLKNIFDGVTERLKPNYGTSSTKLDWILNIPVTETAQRLAQQVNNVVQIVSNAGTAEIKVGIKVGETDEVKRIREYVDYLTEAAHQMEVLNEMASRLGESSLGLTGSWQNVISDFSNSFKMLGDNIEGVVKKGEIGFGEWTQMASAGIASVGTLLNALSDEQDTSSKEGFESQKNYQIGATVMNTLAGVVNAWSSALSITPPVGPILGAANSAMMIALGGIQIAKIRAAKFGGNDSVSGSAVANAITTPTQISNAVQNANIEAAVTDSRVYVVESDIQAVGNKVNVQETENRY